MAKKFAEFIEGQWLLATALVKLQSNQVAHKFYHFLPDEMELLNWRRKSMWFWEPSGYELDIVVEHRNTENEPNAVGFGVCQQLKRLCGL